MYYDMRLKLCSTMVIAGPTQCGKTTLVLDMLSKSKTLFSPPPRRIIWYFGEYKPKIEQKVLFRQGIPSEEDDLQENDLIIIDDLFLESEKSMHITNLFSRIAHHKNTFVIFISQNIYQQGKFARTRALNTQYLIIFSNPRDQTQVRMLSRQMYPTNPNFLIDAFYDTIKENIYGYLLIDLRPESKHRVRTNITDSNNMIVYKEVTHDE